MPGAPRPCAGQSGAVEAHRDRGDVGCVIQTLAPAGERNLYLTGEAVLVISASGEGKCQPTYLLLGDSFICTTIHLVNSGP